MSITDYAAQTQWSERWVRQLARELGITRGKLSPEDVERLDAAIADRDAETLQRNLIETADTLERQYPDDY